MHVFDWLIKHLDDSCVAELQMRSHVQIYFYFFAGAPFIGTPSYELGKRKLKERNTT